MFNAEIPSKAELPSTAKLIKSTAIAAGAAAAILVAVVLPAEYAIDPTGIGRALQLTQMGEIKKQLEIEAAADRAKDRPPQTAPAATPDRRSGLLTVIAGLVVSTAHAHPGHGDDDANTVTSSPAAPSSSIAQPAGETSKSDNVVFTLKPNEGVEYKLTMKKGAKAQYSWRADGDVNYDMHGTQEGGKESSYKKGRGVTFDEGVLTAAYDGGHGWFWRNRGTRDVTVTLRVNGAFSQIKRMN